MKIGSIQNFISFGKQLEGTCGVIKNGKKEACSIYKTENSDIDYFKNLLYTPEWEFAVYLDSICMTDMPNTHIMEDSEKNCLGYVCSLANQRQKGVYLIETCPEYSSQNKYRNIKYVGESLIAFLAETAKRDDCDGIGIYAPIFPAMGFYIKNCGFKLQARDGLVLPSYDFDKLLEKNKEHTKTSINLLI